jgi:hypothetical protein
MFSCTRVIAHEYRCRLGSRDQLPYDYPRGSKSPHKILPEGYFKNSRHVKGNDECYGLPRVFLVILRFRGMVCPSEDYEELLGEVLKEGDKEE